MRSDDRGFSLIELLIVVAVILVIAAIAIPNFLRSRVAANQASAIESLRVIGTAEVTYSVTYGGSYSSTLAQLGPVPSGNPPNSAAAGLIDETLTGGTKSGYVFLYSAGPMDTSGKINSYDLWANPSNFSVTGNVYYYTDQSHVIRGNSSTVASSTDSAVAN